MLVQRFMQATAIVLGAASLAMIFAPELLLAHLAIEPAAATLLLAQLYGTALFGLAMVAWMARAMVLGGIYGKAITSGGFAHAVVGVFALLHTLRSASRSPFLWIAFGVYALLAIGFGLLMFGRVLAPAGQSSR